MISTLSIEHLDRIIGEAVLFLWPLIPLFWLPMRFWPRLKRRLGPFYFLLTGLFWLPFAWLVFSFKEILLGYRILPSEWIRLSGLVLLVLGLFIQFFMAIRLGKRIVGLPELSGQRSHLETSFPFNLCRHPTYLSHFMMFFGAALATGLLAVFLVAVLDLFITLFWMIPLEEKELAGRFGDEYLKYRQKTNMLLPDGKKFLSLLFRHRKKP